MATADIGEKPSQAKRWWMPRFSLRTLIALTILLGTLSGSFGILVRRAHVQEMAAEALRREGTAVTYEFAPVTKLIPANDWTRKVLGRQFFDQVTQLHSQELEVPMVLKHLRRFPDLEKVFLINSYANDETFGYLGNCKKLRLIYAGGTPVKDAGVMALKNSQTLEQLVIWGTKISDESIKAISVVPSLRQLIVQNTKITDASIQSLHSSALRDKLIVLNVSDTNVTASSLPLISEFTSLNELGFQDIDVDIAELKVLTKMPKLRRLSVSGLSAESLADLNEALPNCSIHCSHSVGHAAE